MSSKSGNRFCERTCSNKEVERDDDSKKSHPALMRRYRENRTRRVADDALGRAAAQHVQRIAMTRGGHADEIDLELDGRINDRLHDIAVSKDHRRPRARNR